MPPLGEPAECLEVLAQRSLRWLSEDSKVSLESSFDEVLLGLDTSSKQGYNVKSSNVFVQCCSQIQSGFWKIYHHELM